jgi:hypothetical protein
VFLYVCPSVSLCVPLQWSPTIPGVYSSSVYDGKVAISNVLDCTSAGVDSVNADFSVTHTPGARRGGTATQQQWRQQWGAGALAAAAGGSSLMCRARGGGGL